MSQFYITLPSDSSMNVFPNNTVAHFKTKLAERVHLEGKYEVALTEFIYPNSWINFGDGMIIYRDTPNRMKGPSRNTEINRGYLANGADMVKKLNEVLQSRRVTGATFVYDEYTKTVGVLLAHENTLGMNDFLQDFLGFDQSHLYRGGHVKSTKTLDLNAGMHLMYIYSDIVSHSLVGDTKAPLLRVCNMSGGGEGGETRANFTIPQYMPVAYRDFETIEININNELGQPMPFMQGKSVCTLHFRRIKTLSA